MYRGEITTADVFAVLQEPLLISVQVIPNRVKKLTYNIESKTFAVFVDKEIVLETADVVYALTRYNSIKK